MVPRAKMGKQLQQVRPELVLDGLGTDDIRAASRKSSVASTPGAPATPVAVKQTVRTAKTDEVMTKQHLTGDSTRDKCMELIYDSLANGSNARKSRSLETTYLQLR